MGFTRRHFLLTASKAAIISAARLSDPVYSATSSHGEILLGLASPVYFSGFSPFLNWWKVASAPTIVRSFGASISAREIWDMGGYLDATTGEIVSPAPPDLVSISRTFFKSTNRFQVEAGCNYFGEEWFAIWEGSAAGRIEFARAVSSQVRIDLNKVSFTTREDPDEASLVLTLTDPTDPPRNIRIFQARYRANVENGETFNPDWLAQIRPFGVLRFMGWMPTNNETISEFTQLADENYFAWGQPFESSTANGDFGPKGSMHPRLICDLANQTGSRIHVCIPVQATNSFVESFASYFKNNTNVEVTYELSNECWNSTFSQFRYCKKEGAKIWPGDRAGFLKWYGYRAAECMKIVSDVYNQNGRWRGALATQTVDPKKTLQILAGVDYWRAHHVPPNSIATADLFQSLYVTGYFGDTIPAKEIIHITNANPGLVLCRAHGFKNGQKVKLFITDGPTQLNDLFVTVANCTADTFELRDLSTISMGTQLPACRLATSGALPSSPIYDNRANGVGATLSADSGGLSIGEVNLLENDIILVKDQQRQLENGIYRVARVGDNANGWMLTRVHYFDQETKMLAGSAVRIESGNYANQLFLLDTTVNHPGVSPVRFVRVEPRNYAVDAALFELMEESNAHYIADSDSFPTKYTYFSRQVSLALISGKCDLSFAVSGSIAAMESSYWPQQLAIAQANNLTLRQYEGGCGLAGEGRLLGNPKLLVYDGNPQFGEFLFNFGHSKEAAEAYVKNYEAFWRIGGEYPAKFVADGRSSNAGTWAGVRYWPLQANQNTSDASNPVWTVTLAANSGSLGRR